VGLGKEKDCDQDPHHMIVTRNSRRFRRGLLGSGFRRERPKPRTTGLAIECQCAVDVDVARDLPECNGPHRVIFDIHPMTYY